MRRPSCDLSVVAMLVATLLGGCAGPSMRRHRTETMAARSGCAPRALPVHVWLPPGYDDPGREHEHWPLVLFLHGLFAEGSDPDSLTRDGLPALLERGFAPPAIVVSPQLWAFGQKWDPRVVLPVLDRMIARYRVDADRVVAAGISSGASTGWEVVKACPDRFAGLVVVAGWTTATGVARLRGVPVWAFYAGLDPIAPPPLAARGVRALRASGGCVRLSVEAWQSHWFTQEVLHREDLWAWILSRRRGDRGTAGGR